MARIMMKAVPTNTVEELYPSFLSVAAARGVREKTLETYKQHFRAISKRLDVSIPIKELRKSDLDDMILAMRESGLSDRSINSYTRTLKVFLGVMKNFNMSGYCEMILIQLFIPSNTFIIAEVVNNDIQK